MRKKLLSLFMICVLLVGITGCGNNSSNSSLNNSANKDVQKEQTTSEKLKSYVSSKVGGDAIKSVEINESDNDLYDVILNYDKNIVYLHVCAGDSQYYAKQLIETSNSLNNKINSIKLICKENGTIKYNIDINNFRTLTTSSIESNTILRDDQGNNLNKSVTQAKNDYVNEYKKSCQTYDYKTIFRYAEDYKGKDVKYTGKVVQVIDGYISTSYRVNVTKDKWGYYDDTIYVTFIDLDDNTPRILEDDIITFYGTLSDLYTYETVMGASVTIPSVIATYIDIN